MRWRQATTCGEKGDTQLVEWFESNATSGVQHESIWIMAERGGQRRLVGDSPEGVARPATVGALKRDLREVTSAKKTPAAIQAVSSRWRQSCRGGHRQGIQLTTYGSKCFRAIGPWPTGFEIESLRPWFCPRASTCVLSNPWRTKRTARQERSRDQEGFAFRGSRCGSVIAIRRLEEYWQISESGKNPSRIWTVQSPVGFLGNAKSVPIGKCRVSGAIH
jgi:hypothetical protein